MSSNSLRSSWDGRVRILLCMLVIALIIVVSNRYADHKEVKAWHQLHEEFVSEPGIYLHTSYSEVEDVRNELIRLRSANSSLRLEELADMPEACRARSYHERTRHLSDACWAARQRQAREEIR